MVIITHVTRRLRANHGSLGAILLQQILQTQSEAVAVAGHEAVDNRTAHGQHGEVQPILGRVPELVCSSVAPGRLLLRIARLCCEALLVPLSVLEYPAGGDDPRTKQEKNSE